MHMLTHCKVSLEVLKDRKLTSEQEALLLLGSVIPDVSEFGIVGKETHENNLKFLKELDEDYYYLGVGTILHGEHPRGLDYHTHIKYLPRKIPDIIKIIKHYRRVFPKDIDFTEVAHLVIEFCFDYLTAEKDPLLLVRLHRAVKHKILVKAVYNFANFYQIKSKDVKKIINIGEGDKFKKFIYNFNSIRGLAHNFQNFIFLKTLRDKKEDSSFLDRFTKSSYGFIKSKIKEKRFEQMFGRCIEEIRKDYDPFMKNSINKIKRLVKEKKL